MKYDYQNELVLDGDEIGKLSKVKIKYAFNISRKIFFECTPESVVFWKWNNEWVRVVNMFSTPDIGGVFHILLPQNSFVFTKFSKKKK